MEQKHDGLTKILENKTVFSVSVWTGSNERINSYVIYFTDGSFVEFSGSSKKNDFPIVSTSQ